MPIKITLDGSFSVADARLSHILNNILKERPHQDETWGAPFDDKNTLNDWVAYANIYLGEAAGMKATKEEQRKGVLKAATLLIAALESFDRNERFAPRHYDPENPSPTLPVDLSRVKPIEK